MNDPRESEMTENLIPDEIELRVCPVCGTTNRHERLPSAPRTHYVSGRRCEGEPVTVVYRRADTT